MKQPQYKDEWGTSRHEGYSDIPQVDVAEVQRRARKPHRGTSLVEGFGGLLIVGAFCWATWLLASGHDIREVLQIRAPGGLCIFGVLVSILGRFFR